MGDDMQVDQPNSVGEEREAVKAKNDARSKVVKEEGVEEGEERKSSSVDLTEWTDCETEDFLEADVVDDAAIFSDVFPSIADLCPCLSSCSSSSCSTSAANCSYSTSSSSSSSSSSAWWAVKKNDFEDIEEKQHDPTASNFFSNNGSVAAVATRDQTGSEGMDVLVQLSDDLDLLDLTTDLWDPSSLFPDGEDDDPLQQNQQDQRHKSQEQNNDGNQHQTSSENLSMVFFEWLKSNKKSISPEELRSIKLKRSTIQNAARRLGGGREGMLQLLKLILAWVQNHHLQKRRREEDNPPFPFHTLHDDNANVKIMVNPKPNPCFSAPSNPCWVPNSPYPSLPDPSSMHSPPFFLGMQEQPGHLQQPCAETGMLGGVGYATNAPNIPLPLISSDQMLDPTTSWSHVSVPTRSFMGFTTLGNNSYTNNVLFQTSDCLIKLGRPNSASVTKEARKKRMARQKRFLSHHHRHNQHAPPSDQAKHSNDSNCTNTATTATSNYGFNSHSNWVCWSSSSVEERVTVDAKQHMQPHIQRQVSSDKHQGWKPEKNLRFLLQKVLKQSDVGNLGRIVLPKKEAETHLPELQARDGISIAMEDIGTSQVWNMRYRFWPNNKSRMYLLENTGDFVRSNGLREGDFIVIYSDIKCGKYMIRGVKVRKPESKMEAKIPGRAHQQVQPSSTAVAVNLPHSSMGSSREAVRASSSSSIMESVN